METYNPNWTKEKKAEWASQQSGKIIESQESRKVASQQAMDEQREKEEREKEEKELQLQIELGKTRIYGAKHEPTPEDLRPNAYSATPEDAVANKDNQVTGEKFEKRTDWDPEKQESNEEEKDKVK